MANLSFTGITLGPVRRGIAVSADGEQFGWNAILFTMGQRSSFSIVWRLLIDCCGVSHTRDEALRSF
jgi:hypothetical protein